MGDERLREKAAPIPIEDIKGNLAHWAKVALAMFGALEEHKGIGLAGPQVGIAQRIFITNVDGDEPRVFINPSVIETSQATAKAEEGCLSIPRVWADVERPKSVKMQAWNEKGRSFTIEATGLLARVLLHEYDHLEGVLFVDRLPALKRERIVEKFAKRTKAKTENESAG